MEIVESDDYPILNFEPKAVWNHLNMAEYKMKLDLWLSPDLARKNCMNAECSSANR